MWPKEFKRKPHFYAYWRQGLLGNKTRTWDTLAEVLTSHFEGLVAIRYRGANGGGKFVKDLRLADLERELENLVQQGWGHDDFMFAEQLTPGRPANYLINGEVTRSYWGLHLFFSEENKMMRDALESSGRQVYGFEALMSLRRILWPNDLDYLLSLAETYENHAIEFSGLDRTVGDIPNSRMIIWEVRNY
jgi:hypothetical protein